MQNIYIIIVVQLKKNKAEICIFNITVVKFGYEQKLYTIVLFKINKNLKIYFYYIILFFYLAISLKIKDKKKFLFYIKKII